MQATPSSGGSISPVGTNLHFPRLISKDLAGKRIDLPAELPGERTVLLIAFTREQQHEVDGWVAGLHLNNGKLPWLEVPVIDNPGVLVRWFIDNGMRRGIKDHAIWNHVLTLYTEKAAFTNAVGITSESTVYAMVVDRQGFIIVSVPGSFTPQGAARIQSAVLHGNLEKAP